MSITISKRIGEALILGVYLVVDVLDVWPKSHVLCLSLAFCGIVGIFLIDGMLEDEFPTKRTIVIVALASIASIVVYFVAPLFSEPIGEIELIGSLQPGNDPTPSIPCDPRLSFPANSLKIFVGNNIVVQRDAQIAKITALKIGECSVAAMERAANGLTISAELYGETGKHIAHIGNGQLHVMTNENVRVARDGDLSNLIVTDEFKNELLYIRYMNATTMRIRAYSDAPVTDSFASQITKSSWAQAVALFSRIRPALPPVQTNRA